MSKKIKDINHGEVPVKVVAPEDKAAKTQGRMFGRATLAQISYLKALGGPDCTGWTKYKAAQMIEKLVYRNIFKLKKSQKESIAKTKK